MPFRIEYSSRRRIRHFWSALTCLRFPLSALGVSSSANKKREASFGRPSRLRSLSGLPIPPSADPHRSPPSRVEGTSGNAVPLGNVRPSASILSAVRAQSSAIAFTGLIRKCRVWWWRRVLHKKSFDVDRLESTFSGHRGLRPQRSQLGGKCAYRGRLGTVRSLCQSRQEHSHSRGQFPAVPRSL